VSIRGSHVVLWVPAHGGIWGNNVAEVLAIEEWNDPHLTLAAAVSASPCFGSLAVESTSGRSTVTLGCCAEPSKNVTGVHLAVVGNPGWWLWSWLHIDYFRCHLNITDFSEIFLCGSVGRWKSSCVWYTKAQLLLGTC